MKTNLHHLLLVSLAVTSIACAESNEGTVVPPDKITTDTGVIEVSTEDTAVLDTGTDTGSAMDTPPDGEACAFATKQTRACGFCGTQTRTCLPEGVWGEFGECTDQRGDAECKVGDKRTTDCGNCGTQTDYCDVITCTWSVGSCTGEGPCEKGAEESTRASCAVSGEVRVRTCDNKCQWTAYSPCGLPRGWLPMDPAPITGRSRHAALWTGSKMIVWGGYGASPTTYKADGAAYDPASNTWTTIAAPPVEFKGRRDPHAVWTGSKMIVFGGRDGTETKNDLAIYDPATDTWTTGAVAPLTKRWAAAYAWSTTTNELLVWGGYTGTGTSSVAGDGAAYNPTTNTWTLLPAAPIPARGEPNSVWTGTELLVFAGSKADLSDLVDGARFNPVTRSWTKFSDPPSTMWVARYHQAVAWTGSAFAAWGGITTPAPATILGNGAIYTPLSGWSAIPDASDAVLPPLSRRRLATMFHSSGKLYVFSGIAPGSSSAVSGMAAYDIATGTWANVSTTNAPSARVLASVVWTGREAIVFGGGTTDSTSSTLNNGGIYRP